MRPIIFLDIDGVLKTKRSLKINNEADPSCVEALNHLTDTTKAKLIISSSYRLGAIQYLHKWGVTGEVTGCTPILPKPASRGQEIRAWLNDSWLESYEAARAFVILDDDDMGELSDHLVKTDYETGLTMELAKDAIWLLGHQNRDD